MQQMTLIVRHLCTLNGDEQKIDSLCYAIVCLMFCLCLVFVCVCLCACMCECECMCIVVFVYVDTYSHVNSIVTQAKHITLFLSSINLHIELWSIHPLTIPSISRLVQEIQPCCISHKTEKPMASINKTQRQRLTSCDIQQHLFFFKLYRYVKSWLKTIAVHRDDNDIYNSSLTHFCLLFYILEFSFM